jgi:FkbM family methyltransferase
MTGIASLAGVLKPEYLFRPHQIVRKIWREYAGRKEDLKKARLPWGLEIRINPSESIGWSIYTRSLYETAVTESLWRLARVGDSVVDVGANIGYMSSILAVRVGARGRVYCFEPHPSIFEELRLNVANWSACERCAQFVLHKVALGSHKGVDSLQVPDFFSSNQGTSWIGSHSAQFSGQTFDVDILALDDVILDTESIGVVKLDVEGRGLSVLKGMERLLRERRVRHIVFEEEAGFPAPIHTFLSDMGYVSYGIEQHFGGIRFTRDRQPYFDPVNGPAPNYLATIVSEADVSFLARGFWQSFGPAQTFKSW